MATTYTPNYNLAQPEVGGEVDTWGGLLNTDLLTIDTTMKSISDVANGAVPKAGGTMTGALNITFASGAPALNLSGVSGNNRQIAGQTAGSNRWVMLLGSAGAESGSNVGSDFNLLRYTDAGAFIDSPLSIIRSTGVVSMPLGLNTAGVIASGNIFSGGAVTALQDFKASSNNVVISPTGTTGGVYIRPQGGSGTGETVFGQTQTTTNVPFVAQSGVAAPASPNLFALRATGNFGGGLYFNDPGGAASWGIYTASGSLFMANGAVNGGSLTNRVQVTGGGVVSAADFSATSDRRLKTDLEPITDALERLRQIVPQLYTKDGRREAGVIAQDVQAVLAPAVQVRDDGYLAVSHGQLQALVIAAIHELDERVGALELL